jgi:hypothetical protein
LNRVEQLPWISGLLVASRRYRVDIWTDGIFDPLTNIDSFGSDVVFRLIVFKNTFGIFKFSTKTDKAE